MDGVKRVENDEEHSRSENCVRLIVLWT